MMARSGRMVVISNMLMLGALIIILAHSKPLDAAVALNNETSECAFPFNRYDPVIDQNECRPAMNKMFDCLTYMLGATQFPSANCCSGVVDSWEHFPVCLCRLTFYPPGNITASVRGSLTPLCNVSADLCTPCPELLGLLGRYPNFSSQPQLPTDQNGDQQKHYWSSWVHLCKCPASVRDMQIYPFGRFAGFSATYDNFSVTHVNCRGLVS